MTRQSNKFTVSSALHLHLVGDYYSYYIVYLFKVAFSPDYSLFILCKCDFDGFSYVRCLGRENVSKIFRDKSRFGAL